MSAARGDPQKLNELVYKYPSMISTLKERIGLQDDMKASQAGQLANGVRVAMSQGPQQVQQFIQQNAGAFQALNIDPQEAWQQYQTDPQGFEQAVHAVQLSSIGTKDQLDYANELERNRLTARSQDIQAANLAMNRQFNFCAIRASKPSSKPNWRRASVSAPQRSKNKRRCTATP